MVKAPSGRGTRSASSMSTGERLSFGEVLRRHRVAAGLTQEELAERAGLSARAITDLERGVRRFPYPDTLARLGEALELGPNERAELRAATRRVHVGAVSRDAFNRQEPLVGDHANGGIAIGCARSSAWRRPCRHWLSSMARLHVSVTAAASSRSLSRARLAARPHARVDYSSVADWLGLEALQAVTVGSTRAAS
jgi:transcriptional regulator with XRE-family HTH domain